MVTGDPIEDDYYYSVWFKLVRIFNEANFRSGKKETFSQRPLLNGESAFNPNIITSITPIQVNAMSHQHLSVVLEDQRAQQPVFHAKSSNFRPIQLTTIPNLTRESLFHRKSFVPYCYVSKTHHWACWNVVTFFISHQKETWFKTTSKSNFIDIY
jgi:hypothetical protein